MADEFIDCDDGSGRIILPNDPFWLLRVKVRQGEETPFVSRMLYDYQFCAGSRQPEPVDLSNCCQADGTP
jgi:hypothetical protein